MLWRVRRQLEVNGTHPLGTTTKIEGISNWRRRKSHDLLLTEGTALTSAIVDFIGTLLNIPNERNSRIEFIHLYGTLLLPVSAILKWERDVKRTHPSRCQ